MIRYRRLTKAAISLARHKEDRQEDTEQSVIKEILKNRRRASQETLKAGFSITTLKGNTIVKTYPDGSEKEIASISGKDSHIKVTRKRFSIKAS